EQDTIFDPDQDAEVAAGGAHADGRSDLTLDFGFYPTMRIGSTVWLDDGDDGASGVTLSERGDGVKQSTENGIPGVLVQVFNDLGDLVAETVTDADGIYLFNDLVEDDYVVGIPADQVADILDAGELTAAGFDATALDGLLSSPGQSD